MTYEDLEEKGYNYQQINQIIKAAQIGLNLSELKTDTPVWVMRKIIEINPEVDVRRLNLLANCIGKDLDPKYVLNLNFTYNQAAQILDGQYKGVDVSLYADKNLSKTEMKLIKSGLLKNIDKNVLSYARVYPKQIKNIIDLAIRAKALKLDMVKYLEEGFKPYQISHLLNAYEYNLNLDKYITPEFNNEQISAIFNCMLENKQNNIEMDLSAIAKVDHSKKVIMALYKLKKDNKDIEPFIGNYDVHQLNVINLGISQGLDYKIYANPEFSAEQMNLILNGLQAGLDAKIYANPKLYPSKMKVIFDNLKYNKEHPENAIDVELLCHPEYDYIKMTKYAKILKTGTLEEKLKVMQEHKELETPTKIEEKTISR